MEFIAVAGHQQLPAGVDLPGQGKQTHARHCAGFAQQRVAWDMGADECAGMFHAISTPLNFAPISKNETKQQLVDKP